MKDAQERVELPKVAEWLLKNKSVTLGFLFIVFVLVFVIFRPSNHKPYFEAQKAASQWMETKDEKDLETLLICIKKKPELETKYSTILTNSYLEKKDLLSLKARVAQGFYYLKREFPHYDTFSRASVLMESKGYEKALKETLDLKNKLKKEKLEGTLLYKLNEFRLAIIFQKLGNSDKELLVYENINTQLPFSEKEISFSDYVESRKEKLRR